MLDINRNSCIITHIPTHIGNKKMTNEEYVNYKGTKCPHCQSHNITAESIESDGAIAWSTVECEDCGETWRDVYQLVGYEK